jgi:hypothetical protein
MDGRVLGSLVVIQRAALQLIPFVQSRMHPVPEFKQFEELNFFPTVYWTCIAIWFHIEVFGRGDRSWLRPWLMTRQGTGVLAFMVLLGSVPPIVLMFREIGNLRGGAFYLMLTLQLATAGASAYALIAAMMAKDDATPSVSG